MTTSQNPQVPSVTSSVFNPDQLIAGDAKIVTDTAILLAGQSLLRGTLLGKITKGAATYAATAGNTGNFTVGAISLGANAELGAYAIKFTAATAFNVTAPNGEALPAGAVGTPYTDGELNFTITAGGTAAVAGDSGTITVAAGSGKLTKAVKTAVDGSAVPHSLLIDNVDASLADKNCGVYLAGEFNQNAIILDASFAIADVKDGLRARGIWLKDSLNAADPS